ncbi:MAG: hypothetical protein AB1422_14120 [bacterium]
MNFEEISIHRKKISILKKERDRFEEIAIGRSPMVAASVNGKPKLTHFWQWKLTHPCKKIRSKMNKFGNEN